MLDRLLSLAAMEHPNARVHWIETPDDIAELVRGFDTTQVPLRPIADGPLLAMRAGYYYRDARLLLVGGPVLADVSSGRLGVDKSRALDWLVRHGNGELERRETPVAVGVGGRIVEPATGPLVRHALTDDAALPGFTNLRADAFAGRRGPFQVPLRLPDAVILHGDAVPLRITLTLEPTTACNFDCGFCYGRHLPQGRLRLGNVESLLDNLPCVTAVEITGEGEPLVNRDLFKMIALFKRRNLWVHLTTNGSQLDDAMVARILDSGVDRVATSLESATPERYDRLRPGGDFAAFRRGLMRLREASARRPQPLEMYLWISLLRESIDEIDAMFAFADEVGFDCVEMQALNAMAPYRRIYSEVMQRNILTLSELRKLSLRPDLGARARTILRELVVQYDGVRCAIYDSATMVYWQGQMTPCRLLKIPDVPPMGSLLDTPFETLWMGEDFRRFRFALRHGIVLNSCSGCAFVHAAEYADPPVLT